MCTLEFVYSHDANYEEATLLPNINIDENIKQEYEKSFNEKYILYCGRINEKGGVIAIKVTSDGQRILHGTLVCPEPLREEIQNALNLNL